MRRAVLAFGLVLLAVVPALAQAPPPPAIPNAKVPLAGLLSGGQPTPEQIEEAARAGYRTVINLRGATEEADGYAFEAELVARLGMRYVHLPISSPNDLTRENVARFDAALTEALAEGPVLLHCASGNRDGAMLALREAWIKGADPESALRFGLESGLTRLEPATRELLGLPPAP